MTPLDGKQVLPRLAVLGSGTGSNFVAIQEAIRSGQIAASIVLVASDLASAPILCRAHEYRLPTAVLPPSPFRTKLSGEGEKVLLELAQKSQADWIILAGYMRVVKDPLLQAYGGRILNIHPSLLPAFPGLRAWEQALAAGASETGCTVHYVNAQIDAGQIIEQRRVPIFPDDLPETLHARIQKAEHELYPAVLASLLG